VCGHKFCRHDIVQLGIRKVKREEKTVEALAIELLCPVCQKGSVTTFSHINDFRQLLCILLEEMQKNDRTEYAINSDKQNNAQPGISEKEFTDFKNKLKEMKTYKEFLTELGIEIEEDNDAS
jgi:hypothetical protein